MIFIAATWDDHGVDISAELARMGRFRPDLSVLVQPITQFVQSSNRELRLAGLGANGEVLPDVTESTLERRRRRGDGDGPPLVPNGSESRAIRNLVVDVRAGVSTLTVQSGVIGAPWLAYHLVATPHRPRRDVLGLPPAYWQVVDAMVADEVQQQFDNRPRGFFGRAAGAAGGFFGRLRGGPR